MEECFPRVGVLTTGAVDLVQWLLSSQTFGAGHRPHSLAGWLADGRLGARGWGFFQSPTLPPCISVGPCWTALKGSPAAAHS